MKLYSYFRSSAAYRVRIGLNLKGLDWQNIPVNLLKGEEAEAEYRAVNPQGVVPSLDIGNAILHQSMAILEYLEEKYPEPPLLPRDVSERAVVRSYANIIACDIHPLNNLKVLKYLMGQLGVSESDKLRWYIHWIQEGFQALESLLKKTSDGQFCHGTSATLADINLIPQVYNANRFKVDLSPYPLIQSVNRHCLTIQAFADAVPEEQADAPSNS